MVLAALRARFRGRGDAQKPPVYANRKRAFRDGGFVRVWLFRKFRDEEFEKERGGETSSAREAREARFERVTSSDVAPRRRGRRRTRRRRRRRRRRPVRRLDAGGDRPVERKSRKRALREEEEEGTVTSE